MGAILIETYLLQTMNFHSLIATKATRVTGLNTHTPRSVMEFGTRRAQGESAGNDGAYAAVLGGCIGTANCLAEMKFGAEVKAVGTVAHSFIEFFPTEFDAFKAFADTYPDSVSLLLGLTLGDGIVSGLHLLEVLFSRRVVGVQVRVPALALGPVCLFDLFIACTALDAQHLIGVSHRSTSSRL